MAPRKDAGDFFKKLSAELRAITSGGQASKKAKDAAKWYAAKVKSSMPDISTVLRGKRSISAPLPGQMFTCVYSSKLYEEGTLPYYDAAPLFIFLDVNQSGNLVGLNLHYLPPVVRLRVLGFLIEEVAAHTNTLRHDTSLRVSWAKVQSMQNLKPLQGAIKSYIPNRIQSDMVRIQPVEWDKAVALPYQRFIGASERTAWKHASRASR